MGKTAKTILTGLFLTGIVLCLPVKAELVDRILAQVNDDIILQSEFDAFVRPVEARIRKKVLAPEKQRSLIAKMYVEVLDQLIDQKLAAQQIRKLNIVVSDKEVDDSIERLKQANFLTDQELIQTLEQDGITYQQYREEIKSQIERARLVAYEVSSKIVITEADIRRYYKKHRDRYGEKVRMHLRHILMTVAPGASAEEKKEVYEQMQKVYRRLLNGEPFAELARAYSESPVAGEGGDLGLIDPQSLADSIKGPISALKEGGFTPVLETDQGYQVFFLEKLVKIPAKPLEKVREEIRRGLYNQVVDEKYRQWLKELKARSHIRILCRPGSEQKAAEPEKG